MTRTNENVNIKCIAHDTFLDITFIRWYGKWQILKAKKFKSVCAPCENSHHFFFDCNKHTDNREILFNSLNWLPSNISVERKSTDKRK